MSALKLKKLLSLYREDQPDLAPATVEAYRVAIRKFRRFLGRKPRLSDLNDETVRAFLLEYRKHVAPGTVRNKRRQLLALWRFAYRTELTEVEPRNIPREKVPRRVPVAWTPEQVGLILDHCDAAPALDGWDVRHWRALVATAYVSLHRVQCLMKLRLDQIDLQTGWMTAKAEQLKQDRDHSSQIAPWALELVRETLDGDRERLFPWPLHPRTLGVHYKKILRAAGLPCDRKSMFHRLRKTSYTIVHRELGVEAATQIAGHSKDLSKHYADPFWADVRRLW